MLHIGHMKSTWLMSCRGSCCPNHSSLAARTFGVVVAVEVVARGRQQKRVSPPAPGGVIAKCLDWGLWRSLATRWLFWTYLDFQSASAEKGVDRLRIFFERNPIRDHRLTVDAPLLEQRKRPLEAVEDRHRADDLDLVVADAKRRKGGHRVGVGHAEHEERASTRNSAQAVFDGANRAGGVDDHVPALRLVELICGNGGAVSGQLLGQRVPLWVRVDDVDLARAAVFRKLRQQQPHRAGSVDQVTARDLK